MGNHREVLSRLSDEFMSRSIASAQALFEAEAVELTLDQRHQLCTQLSVQHRRLVKEQPTIGNSPRSEVRAAQMKISHIEAHIRALGLPQ